MPVIILRPEIQCVSSAQPLSLLGFPSSPMGSQEEMEALQGCSAVGFDFKKNRIGIAVGSIYCPVGFTGEENFV